MVYESSYKVPGGKLIKVRVSIVDNRISELIITGDFFLHPESTLPKIEKSLLGCTLDKDKIASRVQSSLDANSAYAVGFTASDMAEAIMKAFG